MHRFSQTIGWTLPSSANFSSAISSPWQYVTNSLHSSKVCEVSESISWLNQAPSQEVRISCVDGRPYALRLIYPPEFTPDNPKSSKVPMSVTAAFVAGARRLSGLLFAPIHGPTEPVFGTRPAFSTNTLYSPTVASRVHLHFLWPSFTYVSINSIWNLSGIFTSKCNNESWDDNDMVKC